MKLIVMSADAMVTEDLALLRTLPNFKKYLAGGVNVEHIQTIYPTITYPIHTTIVTGCYPNKHGIFGNLDFTVGKHIQPWMWDHKFVKVPDIFDAAKKAGKTTAAVFWPVTGNHPSIDYLCDEYWVQNESDTHEAAFRRMGSSPEVLEIIKKYENILVDRRHPDADDFVVHVAAEIFKRFTPDLLMLHPANMDAYRHRNGVFDEKNQQGIFETDRYIGWIMAEVEKAGLLSETNLCLISDHGQMDIKRVMNLNVKFVQNGLIELDDQNEIKNWDAYCLSGGLSALVFLRYKNNKAIYDKTYALLKRLCDEGVYGISEVYTEKEVDTKERFGGDFSFVLETDGFSSFADRWVPPLVDFKFAVNDYRTGAATHGYLPRKGPQPIFVARGPSFKENHEEPWHHIVDEAPTFAKVLGFEMHDIDGKCMDAILRDAIRKNLYPSPARN